MEFPTSQLQASVALTMFSPDVLPALYGQLNNSEQSTNRNRRRDIREGIDEGDSEQHQRGHKSNLKKLGYFFRRRPHGSLVRSSQATIQSSQCEDEDADYLRDLEPPQILSPEDSADVEDTLIASIQSDSENSHNERPKSPETEKRKDAYESSSHFRTHQRAESFHVNLTADDIQRIAKEIYDQTIADVNLSLFSYWINQNEENYEEAKRYIRELRLDHGYNLARIANVHLRKLMQDVFNQRPVEAHIALSEKVALSEIAMATSRTPTSCLFPRIDALPKPLRVERQRAVSQAVLRPVSIDSLSPAQRNYPPDTPDRPPPLSVRPSNATLRSSPSLPIGFSCSESPPLLPFGFPSPGSALRVSSSSFPALESYTSSLYDENDFDDEKTEKSGDDNLSWESRVADIYERVVGLERPEQLDQVIRELQELKALYCDTPAASQKKRS